MVQTTNCTNQNKTYTALLDRLSGGRLSPFSDNLDSERHKFLDAAPLEEAEAGQIVGGLEQLTTALQIPVQHGQRIQLDHFLIYLHEKTKTATNRRDLHKATRQLNGTSSTSDVDCKIVADAVKLSNVATCDPRPNV